VATVCGEPSEATLRLDWKVGQNSVRYQWSDRDFCSEDLPPQPDLGNSLTLSILAQETSWLGRLFRGDLFHAEWQALKDRLFRPDLDVFVNGALLSLKEQNAHLYRPILAEGGHEGSFVVYRFHRSLVLPRYMDWAKSSRYKERRGDYGSRPMPVTATTVHWVLDGIVVDRWSLDSAETAVAAEVYLAAEGLELDLSGFAVAESEEADRRIAETHLLQRTLLDGVGEDLPEKLEHPAHRQKVKGSVWGADLLVGIVIPPYLMLGLLDAIRLRKLTRKYLEADLALCREHIRLRQHRL